jgi:hypothetical protein
MKKVDDDDAWDREMPVCGEGLIWWFSNAVASFRAKRSRLGRRTCKGAAFSELEAAS